MDDILREQEEEQDQSGMCIIILKISLLLAFSLIYR